MPATWTLMDSTNYLKNVHGKNKYSKDIRYIKIDNNTAAFNTIIYTRRGLDQENSAPDNASDTQSPGVPEEVATKN